MACSPVSVNDRRCVMRDLPRISKPIVGLQFFLPFLLVLFIMIAFVGYVALR